MKETIEMNRTLHIESGNSGPKVLLLAGVHGDEYEPIVALMELAEELAGVIHRGSVLIDPLVNAGAYEAVSRFGADGLDLARVCAGSADGSPTEQAAYRVSERIKNADVVIDLHTGGMAFDIYPLAGYMLHPNASVLEQQRQLALSTGMPLLWGTDHRPDGRTLSVARDADIPAIYLEYGGGSGFRKHVAEHYKEAVKRILAQLNMLRSDGMNIPQWKYWLEDYRTDSGYLQSRMPAPVSGMFVPDVAVGDWALAGQRFGCIIDPYTRSKHELFVEEAGLVFLLQQRVSVQKGDALGGIMNVTLNEKISIDNGEGSNH
ncbi:succinylglutamate desuccinylase/aspartoacylase family protein [Parapedobacter pyrenivorans]|nr:M14 family metallopeptidase [Parapedobacter pyrenivorans]